MGSLLALCKAVVVVVVSMWAAAPGTEAGSWCIARSGTSQAALQTALDYACGAGADCGSIQPSGLCYLPNTLQAHASYAFNSYYQRSNYAPGSCDFAGTATLTVSDPSYGSCSYPSTPSAAGGTLTPPSTSTSPPVVTTTPPGTTPVTGPTNTPITFPMNGTISPITGGGTGSGGLSPGFGGTGSGGLSPGFGGTTTTDAAGALPIRPLFNVFILSSIFSFLPLLLRL